MTVRIPADRICDAANWETYTFSIFGNPKMKMICGNAIARLNLGITVDTTEARDWLCVALIVVCGMLLEELHLTIMSLQCAHFYT